MSNSRASNATDFRERLQRALRSATISSRNFFDLVVSPSFATTLIHRNYPAPVAVEAFQIQSTLGSRLSDFLAVPSRPFIIADLCLFDRREERAAPSSVQQEHYVVSLFPV